MNKFFNKLTSIVSVIAITASLLPMVVSASATKGPSLIADNDPGFDTRVVSSTNLANAPFGTNDKNWISRGTAVVSDTRARSGANSIKITGSGSTGPRAVLTNLTAGKKYWVSAWVYTEEGGKFIRMGLQGTSTSYTTYSYLTKNTWTQIGGVVEAPTGGDAATKGTTGIEGAWALFVNVGNGTIGDFWFDDFEICEVTSEATPAIITASSVLGVNAGFESGSKTSWREDSPSYYVKKSSVDANSGDYAAHVTRRSAAYNTPQMFVEDANLEDNTYYYARAMLRQGSPSSSEIKAFMRMETQSKDANGNDITGTSIGVPSDRAVLNTSTYTKVASIFKNVDAKRVKIYAATDEAATTEGKLVDIWADDYALVPITASVAGKTDVMPNSTITLSVPEDLKDATLTLDKGATVVNTTKNGLNWTVSLGNMEYGTAYSLTLNTPLAQDPVWTFTTAQLEIEGNNLLKYHDPGFEAKTDGTTIGNTAFGDRKWISRGTAQIDGTRGHESSKSVKVTSNTGIRAVLTSKDIDEGALYYASAWVYTENDSVNMSVGMGGSEGWTAGKLLTKNAWTKVDGVIVAPAAGDASVKATYSDITDGYVLYLKNESTALGTFWVDDFELVKIGKQLSGSDAMNLDNMTYTIDITRIQAETYAKMEDIANDIEGAEDYDVTVDDKDGSGNWTDGDVITFVSKTSGEDYTYSYTVNVIEYYETETVALIVKGSDGQGDDFCRADTITKAGNAFIEYRVTNNSGESITPAVVMASYDESGKITDIEVIDNETIANGSYADYQFNTVVPSAAEGAQIKLMVWENISSMVPVIPASVYTIETNDFTVPNVISNGMVLQRNSDAVIFGKAPEGAVVTAELSGGITASYEVPVGDNEFFVELPMEEYSNEEQTLTITAEKQGESLGTITKEGILVGDVFYGSGQSNMERKFYVTSSEIQAGQSSIYTPAQATNFINEYKELGRKIGNKNVRYFTTMTERIQQSRESWDQEELASKEIWQTLNESNISGTNETMVRMAGAIYDLTTENSEVPIGIVICCQGGTELSKWVSRDNLLNSGNFDQKAIDEYEANITKLTDTRYWAGHTDLYYDGVRSVMPYTVKAAVWYQGESDSTENYDKYLKALIGEMRVGMRNEELPYLIVQFPGYESTLSDNWGRQRLQQWNAQTLGNVYTVVTNDTGDNKNIHPANKNIVGDRLARMVLAKIDGENVPYTGPTYKSASYGTGTATITVETYGGTLSKYATTVGSPAFELTTDGGATWTAANSVSVSGNTITVGNNSITGTVNGVRYAYVESVLKCIYADFDGAKLPLVPFDTTFVFTNLK